MALVLRVLLLLLLTVSLVFPSPISNKDWVCSKNTTRHTRSIAEKELQSLIATIKREIIPGIKAMHPYQSTTKKRSCPRINKLIGSISVEKDIVLAHQKFLQSLMEMSILLEHLKQLSFNKQFMGLELIRDTRDEIFSSTKTKLTLVICEFDDIIAFEYNATVLDFDPATKRINCMPKDPDYTQIGALDLQYFTKLRRLFRTGRAILKKLKRRGSKQRTHLKNNNKKRITKVDKKITK